MLLVAMLHCQGVGLGWVLGESIVIPAQVPPT